MFPNIASTISLFTFSDENLRFPLQSSAVCCFLIQDSKKKIAPGAIKAPEGKRIRKERGELEDIVFKLFERRPNWALKQLVEETDQPVVCLRDFQLLIVFTCVSYIVDRLIIRWGSQFLTDRIMI
jgi:hypothetical protein